MEEQRLRIFRQFLTFIDFKKAFDSIHRGILIKILRAYGIPDAIVNLIDRMYTDTTAKVITADGLTEIFLNSS